MTPYQALFIRAAKRATIYYEHAFTCALTYDDAIVQVAVGPHWYPDGMADYTQRRISWYDVLRQARVRLDGLSTAAIAALLPQLIPATLTHRDGLRQLLKWITDDLSARAAETAAWEQRIYAAERRRLTAVTRYNALIKRQSQQLEMLVRLRRQIDALADDVYRIRGRSRLPESTCTVAPEDTPDASATSEAILDASATSEAILDASATSEAILDASATSEAVPGSGATPA